MIVKESSSKYRFCKGHLKKKEFAKSFIPHMLLKVQ
jgi:hypothetical protein